LFKFVRIVQHMNYSRGTLSRAKKLTRLFRKLKYCKIRRILNNLFQSQNSLKNFGPICFNMTEIKWKDRQMRTGKGYPVTCHRKHRVGVTVQLHSFLTLALDGQHHDPVTLSPAKNPATHCCGGRDGPRAVLDLCGEQKVFCSNQGLKPGPSSPWRFAKPIALSLNRSTVYGKHDCASHTWGLLMVSWG